MTITEDHIHRLGCALEGAAQEINAALADTGLRFPKSRLSREDALIRDAIVSAEDALRFAARALVTLGEAPIAAAATARREQP